MSLNYVISELVAAVDRFPQVKVLVIGDVMLDEFIWGTVNRISPEAPVPVVDVRDESRLLGGAANVINNIVSAGGRALLAGVVGDDRAGREVGRMLQDLGVDARGIIVDPDRPTTIKTRVVAHAQQVVRIDRERRVPMGPDAVARLKAFLAEAVSEVDAVIISDYGKGVVSQELMDEVHRLFYRPGAIIAVDPKVNNFNLYRKATTMTPNHHEAAMGSGVAIDSEESLVRAGWKLVADLDLDSVLITRGERGMTLFERGVEPMHIPTVAREVYDVTGAGDTVIAILVMGRAAGLSAHDAAILANFAAGVVVGEVGTSAVTAEELKEKVIEGARGLNGLCSDH